MSISKFRKLVMDYSKNPEMFSEGNSQIDYDYSPPRLYKVIKPLPRVLEDEGFATLGSGCYSWVFDLGDGKRVVKIVKREDEAYEKFVNYCKSSENSSLKPKILYTGKWGNHTVYVLEKLVEDGAKARAVSAIVCMLKEQLSSYERDRLDQDFLISLLSDKIGKQLHTLILALYDTGSHLDLHSGNIMFRKNGEIVLTDPLS